jgi:biotin operon repressor
MESSPAFDELLEFLKALADANRLKIIGLLARQPLSVEQLAALLGLRPSTVSHHLARLAQAGLVSARPESYYNIYQFEPRALEGLSQRLLAQEALKALAQDLDLDAYDRKVVKSFTGPDGRLKALPAQQKKFQAILRYVLQAFQPGVRYTEKEVNELLSQYSADTASLRRGLIEYKLMQRAADGSAYWRVDPPPA